MFKFYYISLNKDLDIDFYCTKLKLFKLQYSDDHCFELKPINNEFLVLVFNLNTKYTKLNSKHTLFSIEVPNCFDFFNQFNKISFEGISGIYEEPFGRLLSSPVGSQFSMIDPSGNKFIIYSNTRSLIAE
jgi:hypothetical protein